MKYTNMWAGSAAIASALLMVFAITAIAGDESFLDVTLDVQNSIPTITSMVITSASYDPVEDDNSTVTVNINVTDQNGVSNLDNGKVYIYVDDAATFVAPVNAYTRKCVPTHNWTSTKRQYRCQTDLRFFDAAGTYSTNITAGDTQYTVWNNTGTNAPTFTYTTLLAFNISSQTVGFNTPAVGVVNYPSVNNPTVLQNTGNADLYLNVTGANLVGASHTFNIGNFSVSLDSTPTAEQVLSTASQQINVTGTRAQMLRGAASLEDLYWFVDVPVGTAMDSYTSSAWLLKVYEQ